MLCSRKRKNAKTLSPYICFPAILYLLLHRLWPGSLVNRASDSGSEGRGFESLPGHINMEINKSDISTGVSLFVFYCVPKGAYLFELISILPT